ncbi:MAG: hypothetical protein U0694_03655 [Anaerolineae bacterium]
MIPTPQNPQSVDQERIMNIRIAAAKQARRIALLTPLLFIVVCVAGVAVGIGQTLDNEVYPSGVAIFNAWFGDKAGSISLLLICFVLMLLGIIWFLRGLRRTNEEVIRRDLEKTPPTFTQFY